MAMEVPTHIYLPLWHGVRLQPMPSLRRVVRGDYLRDMSYPYPL